MLEIEYIIYNALMFGSLYALGKYIEMLSWQFVVNYEKYEALYVKWVLKWTL